MRSWDVAPPPEYFDELARVSQNQVIWGGNYFGLPPTRCFLVWRKPISENFTMAMCEYAWTSFNANAKWIEMPAQGTRADPRIHPTQKPIALYTWILQHYAKPGYRILDTHVGSASSLIACHRAGLPYVGFELDATYYTLAKERLDAELAQMRLFQAPFCGDLRTGIGRKDDRPWEKPSERPVAARKTNSKEVPSHAADR